MVPVRMKSLRRHDVIHLEAAEGWLELDDAAEAGYELDCVSPEGRRHPEVLELRWKILARKRNWLACLETAEALTDVVPRQAMSWLLLAASLHELHETEDACETLMEVMDEFPDEPAFPYRLACYCCHLGQLHEAKEWLDQACQLGSPELRRASKADPALKALWENPDR